MFDVSSVSDEDGYQFSPIVVGFEADVTPCDGLVIDEWYGAKGFAWRMCFAEGGL